MGSTLASGLQWEGGMVSCFSSISQDYLAVFCSHSQFCVKGWKGRGGGCSMEEKRSEVLPGCQLPNLSLVIGTSLGIWCPPLSSGGLHSSSLDVGNSSTGWLLCLVGGSTHQPPLVPAPESYQGICPVSVIGLFTSVLLIGRYRQLWGKPILLQPGYPWPAFHL